MGIRVLFSQTYEVNTIIYNSPTFQGTINDLSVLENKKKIREAKDKNIFIRGELQGINHIVVNQNVLLQELRDINSIYMYPSFQKNIILQVDEIINVNAYPSNFFDIQVKNNLLYLTVSENFLHSTLTVEAKVDNVLKIFTFIVGRYVQDNNKSLAITINYSYDIDRVEDLQSNIVDYMFANDINMSKATFSFSNKKISINEAMNNAKSNLAIDDKNYLLRVVDE